MAGPELSSYLKAQDFEAFRRLVRHYNHDMANSISRITTECSILIRIADKVDPTEALTDPSRMDEIKQIAAAAKRLVDNLNRVREFFYPGGDTEGSGLKKYAPYDASAWDSMAGEFITFLTERLEPIEPLFQRLEMMEGNALIKPDGRARPILTARMSMSKSVGEMEDLLTAEQWDKLLPEWLNRPE